MAGILFYNVENLFNPEPDSVAMDDEYLPQTFRQWNHYRKKIKQANISKVILYAGKWEPPVLVGVCEVEDKKVVDELIWTTGLNHFTYSVIHFDSPDRRGIDVALIYRKDRFKVLRSFPVEVKLPPSFPPTRDILYVCGILDEIDTLHVLVNHWPSRWGGEASTRIKRLIAAKTLKNICDSILSVYEHSKIIAMGDFNDEPNDESLKIVSRKPGTAGKNLINLAWNPVGKVPGTLKHQNAWFCFDQILVSSALFAPRREGGFFLKDTMMHVIAADFLLEKDYDYSGVKPFRTFEGNKYKGGFSDHLPVMIKLMRVIE